MNQLEYLQVSFMCFVATIQVKVISGDQVQKGKQKRI